MLSTIVLILLKKDHTWIMLARYVLTWICGFRGEDFQYIFGQNQINLWGYHPTKVWMNLAMSFHSRICSTNFL